MTSTLTIPGGGTIASIEVTNLKLSHTYASDVDVYLLSPQGTRVELFTDVCGGQAWTAATTGFTLADSAAGGIGATCPPGTGSYRPEGSLAALLGQPAAGTWTLEVTDDGPLDVGTLTAWGLRVGTGNCGTATATSTPLP